LNIPITGADLRAQGELCIAVGLAIALAIFSFSYWSFWTALASAGLGGTMLAIAVVDARQFRIPDALSFPMIVAGLAVTTCIGDTSQVKDHAAAALVASGGLLAVSWIYFQARHREGLGLGDVKLAAVAGAWDGLAGLGPVLLIASVSALVMVATLNTLVKKPYTATSRIPFGTFLAPSIWIVFMLQHQVLTP
jgi:leader peptidase (prepilin peptidase) / N-methyltransferase